jgi:hypothetical protein
MVAFEEIRALQFMDMLYCREDLTIRDRFEQGQELKRPLEEETMEDMFYQKIQTPSLAPSITDLIQ